MGYQIFISCDMKKLRLILYLKKFNLSLASSLFFKPIYQQLLFLLHVYMSFYLSTDNTFANSRNCSK